MINKYQILHKIALTLIKNFPFNYYPKRTIIGLAAGFDKNCDILSHIHKLGFAFAEVGSLTPNENKGNKYSKIIKSDYSMINNLGLPNIGVDKAISKLKYSKPHIPILINISPLPDNTFQDMQTAVSKIQQYCSGIVLNLSCPNVNYKEECKLDHIDLIKISSNKPLFIKLSPYLTYSELKEIVSISQEKNINGYVLTNSLPTQRGGLSGRKLKEFSNASIKVVNKLKDEKQIIIGCGGIETSEDIIEKIDLGANYVELLTSFLFKFSPNYIHNLNTELRINKLSIIDNKLSDVKIDS